MSRELTDLEKINTAMKDNERLTRSNSSMAAKLRKIEARVLKLEEQMKNHYHPTYTGQE